MWQNRWSNRPNFLILNWDGNDSPNSRSISLITLFFPDARETALHSDPFFYDEHVSVTINNGVVTLHGIVFDDWDLRSAMRMARRMPGVKRVVNDLEIKLGGE
jgi:hypothetical protein